MSAPAATVRVMSPEEIATRRGGETPFLHWPVRESVFAERSMRLRQRARDHAMGDFLLFMAELARIQQAALQDLPALPVPDRAALDAAARAGRPPIPAVDWPRDPAWQVVLRRMARELGAAAPEGARPTLEALARAESDFLERQADAVLTGVMAGLDLAAAPLVGAALQVYWTHLLLETRRLMGPEDPEPLGRIADETVCPCCGSRPTASITRSAGESLGQRYLHCSLCSLQWHMVRIQCAHCLGSKGLAYQSLDTVDGDLDAQGSRAAQAVLQAETCDSCGHYLKIMHTDRDAFVEPVADDLASITLDLLVSETGKRRHGVNLLLLFGDPGDPPPDPGGP